MTMCAVLLVCLASTAGGAARATGDVAVQSIVLSPEGGDAAAAFVTGGSVVRVAAVDPCTVATSPCRVGGGVGDGGPNAIDSQAALAAARSAIVAAVATVDGSGTAGHSAAARAAVSTGEPALAPPLMAARPPRTNRTADSRTLPAGIAGNADTPDADVGAGNTAGGCGSGGKSGGEGESGEGESGGGGTFVVVRTHGTVGSGLFRYYAESLPDVQVWCIYDATRGRSTPTLAALAGVAAAHPNFHVLELSDADVRRRFPGVHWPWHADFTPKHPYVPPIGYYMHTPSLLLLLDHLAAGGTGTTTATTATAATTATGCGGGDDRDTHGVAMSSLGAALAVPPCGSLAAGVTGGPPGRDRAREAGAAMAAAQLPKFMWVLEDDSFFLGDLGAFLRHFDSATEDYIGRFVHTTQGFLDKWTHWKQRTFDPATTPGWGLPTAPPPPLPPPPPRDHDKDFPDKAPKGKADIVEKSEHVERLSVRLLLRLGAQMAQDHLLYGEIYETTFCAAAANRDWCTMRQMHDAEFEAADTAHYSFFHQESQKALAADARNPRLSNRWVHAVKWVRDDAKFAAALREMPWAVGGGVAAAGGNELQV